MKNLNVLIADDAPFIREILRKIFLKLGHSVLAEAENGVEAVAQAQKHNPDLIVMDIVMPLKSGIEATIEIKKVLPHIKIIACSTLDQETMLLKVMEAGADGFINKPFDVKQIQNILDKLNNSKA